MSVDTDRLVFPEAIDHDAVDDSPNKPCTAPTKADNLTERELAILIPMAAGFEGGIVEGMVN